MDHCFLSFSIDYFIGLLYFIDDVDNTLGHNCQWTDNIRTELFDILTRFGPQKMEVYIKQHLNGWKTEKVRFAVAGRSATGKSTFINKFRGIKEGQDGFADVGFGDETEKISEYRHPLNENIVFCDLPGLSMKFTKRKFLEMVNLSEYPYILIFFESVLTEDDEWLTVQIQENGIPFCLVRSKIYQDVESYKGKQIGEKGVLLKIRQTIIDSMAENTTLAKAELFIISSEKPHIGEMSNLQDYMKTKLPSSQFAAVVLSLSILTEAVVEKKILELIKRIPYLSIGIAILTSLSSLLSVPLDIALCVPEVRHYVTVFGLDQKYDENIEGLKNNFSKVSVDDFITRKYRIALDHQPHRSPLYDVPIIGSVYVCYETKKFVNEFLSDILYELQQDAITVYKHFFKKGQLLATDHLQNAYFVKRT